MITKPMLIKDVAMIAGITLRDAKVAIRAVEDALISHLESGKCVKTRLGIIGVKTRRPMRTMRNVRKREHITDIKNQNLHKIHYKCFIKFNANLRKRIAKIEVIK